MKMFPAVPLLLMMMATVLAGAAHAEVTRVYADPTLANMNKAMLRAGALDPSRREVLRDYMLIHECDMFRQNQQDDFRMEKIENAIATLIAQQKTQWPDAFTFATPLTLDKYDFTNSMFAFTAGSRLQNVNTLVLLEGVSNVCQQGVTLAMMPNTVAVHIEQPVTVTGIPLPKDVAAALLQRMLKSGNDKRQIYARFKIVANYMKSMDEQKNAKNSNGSYYTFDGTLQGIDFFEDEAMTRPIWSFSR